LIIKLRQEVLDSQDLLHGYIFWPFLHVSVLCLWGSNQ